MAMIGALSSRRRAGVDPPLRIDLAGVGSGRRGRPSIERPSRSDRLPRRASPIPSDPAAGRRSARRTPSCASRPECRSRRRPPAARPAFPAAWSSRRAFRALPRRPGRSCGCWPIGSHVRNGQQVDEFPGDRRSCATRQLRAARAAGFTGWANTPRAIWNATNHRMVLCTDTFYNCCKCPSSRRPREAAFAGLPPAPWFRP